MVVPGFKLFDYLSAFNLLLSELIRLVLFRHGSPLDAQGDIIPPPRKKGGRKFLFRQNHVPQIGGVRRDKMDQALDDPNVPNLL